MGCELNEPVDVGEYCENAIDYKDYDGVSIGRFDDINDRYYGFIHDNKYCPAQYPICAKSIDGDYFCHQECSKGQIFCGSGCIDPNNNKDYCGAKNLCNNPDPKDENFSGYTNCLSCRNGECECAENAHEYETLCEPDSIDNCGKHGNNCKLSDNALSVKCENKECLIELCNNQTFLAADEKSCITCEDLIKNVKKNDVIKFGRYYQKSNNEVDKQPINWIVIRYK